VDDSDVHHGIKKCSASQCGKSRDHEVEQALKSLDVAGTERLRQMHAKLHAWAKNRPQNSAFLCIPTLKMVMTMLVVISKAKIVGADAWPNKLDSQRSYVEEQLKVSCNTQLS